MQPKTKDYLHAIPLTYINKSSSVQIEKPDKEAFDISELNLLCSINITSAEVKFSQY